MKIPITISFRRRRTLSLLFFLLCLNSVFGIQLQIGQGYTLSVDAPSGGWVDAASWSSSNPAVSIEDYGSGVCMVYPWMYFQGTATIECFFSYSYQTYYNGRYHIRTGTATKHFYVTCVTPSVSITPNKVTVKPGEKVHSKLNVSPVSSSKYPIVEWKYSDGSVAWTYFGSSYSLDNGYREIDVETRNTGTCIVTADIGGGLTASCEITVKNIPPTGISLSPSSTTLAIGDTKQLNYTLTPFDASSDITWTTSSSSVATVSSSGYVTAKGVGSARITVTTSNGLSSTCEVTVYKPVPSSIKLSKTVLKIPVGSSEKLTCSVSPSNAIYTTAWSSDNTAVATVNNSGTITAVAPGTAYVTVLTDNGYSDRCMVQVPPLPESIALPANIKIGLGKTYQLACNVYPTDAMSSYTWSSSDAMIASVNSNGIVTARGVGTTVITVRSTNGLVANCNVTVPETQYTLVVWTTDGESKEFPFAEKPQVTIHDKVFTVSSQLTTMEFEANDILRITLEEQLGIASSIKVAPSTLLLTVGDSQSLSYVVEPSNAAYTVTWGSSDPSVATVDAQGVVRALADGTAVITATTDNGLSATCTVTVRRPSASGISISLNTLSLTVGDSQSLSYVVEPSNAAYTLTWESSDPSVATVDEQGVVRALADGTADITATTDNGLSAACTVTVSHPSASGISISPNTLSLIVGDSQPLSYVVEPSNAAYTLTWESSDPSVATVDEQGVVRALADGTAVITATTDNGLSATCTLTVRHPSASGISISPNTLSLIVGDSQPLSYVVEPSNAAYTLTWESSDPSVATVDEQGVVRALADGTAVITATTDNGLSATCTLTVRRPSASGISISLNTLSLTVGDSQPLSYVVEPSNAAYTVTWESSDPSVATVNEKGVVYAVSPGMAIISVTTDNGLTAECNVNVEVPSDIHSVGYAGTGDLRLSVKADHLLIGGCKPETLVAIYAMSGKLIVQRYADKDGCLTVSLSSLPQGVYVIKTENKTVKYIRK